MGRRSRGEMPRVVVVKPHGHARVRIGGKAYWLGKCPDGKPTPAQQAEAARLWQQYLVKGKPPARKRQAVVTPAQPVSQSVLTIGELMAQFLAFAEGYYRRQDGTITSSVDEIRMADRSLAAWAAAPVDSFGPKALKAVQVQEIDRGPHEPQQTEKTKLTSRLPGRILTAAQTACDSPSVRERDCASRSNRTCRQRR